MKRRTGTGKGKAAVFLPVLLLCLSWPRTDSAYALESAGKESLEDTRETEVVFPSRQGSQEVLTELTGTIEVSLISVTMPSDGFEFYIEPGNAFDAVTNPAGQILCPSPESLKITNNSVVAVRLEIASVGDVEDLVFQDPFADGPEQSFRLVDRISEVNGYGKALLVLGRAGKPETAPYTSEADFEQYAICPGKTGIPITDLEAGESTGLQLYGTAKGDFYGEYQFTVKPTLKISAVRAPQRGWFK